MKIENIYKNNNFNNTKKEELSYIITGLIGKENFEYQNLIEYKREYLEKSNKSLIDIEVFLNKKQIDLLINYKEELYLSSIYGTPINETVNEKINLEIGEQLYLLVKKVNEIILNKK